MASTTDEQGKKANLLAMFGDDEEEEDSSDADDVKPTPQVSMASTADVGLFQSDSSSDEAEEKPPSKKRKRMKKRKIGEKRGSRTTTEKANSGDEYDSEPVEARNKEDDAFIDEDDELADVLGEYKSEQVFNDERPLEYEPEELEHDKAQDNFFDETLKSLRKGRRSNRIQLGAHELEQLVQEVLYKMDTAWTNDEEKIKEKKPAMEKLKLLDFVVNTLSKLQLQSTLLDFNVLEIMKKWIQPMENGKLGNVGIRSKILNISKRLPIYKDHLKRSGYGKVVMALWKHPDETADNKLTCQHLIERWSRAVFEKSMDYRKLAEYDAEKAPYRRVMPVSQRVQNDHVMPKSSSSRQTSSNDKPDYGIRVKIPQAMPMDFVHRPKPKFEWEDRASSKVDATSVKGRLGKRMQNISRPSRKNGRAVNMSIEGRGQ